MKLLLSHITFELGIWSRMIFFYYDTIVFYKLYGVRLNILFFIV